MKSLRIRFWPESLAGQIAVLVAIALLVAQAINFGLLLRERRQHDLMMVSAPTIARLVDAVEREQAGLPERSQRRGMSRTIRVSKNGVIQPDMKMRADVQQRAAATFADLGITPLKIVAAETDIDRIRRPDRLDELRRSLVPADRRARPTLIVEAQIGPDRWISSSGRMPFRDRRVVLWLFVQTLILYGVVLAPVIWAGRRIARPLKQLTSAVESFRSAENSVAVPEAGPGDVRRLIAAYNGMRSRITGLLDEKDRMLGAIGHDLRTPLASLRVRAEGMEDVGERDRMAATIEEMNQTLDDILSLARLGRPSESETRVDLAALLDSVVDDFDALGADVVLEETRRTTVTLRPTLIARVMRNLIDNAIKYGERARVAIEEDALGVTTIIDDDGPGIPEGRIEDMFVPFARLEESRSRETGGSGLGLALARAIIDQHRGTLTLENRSGGGLRAKVWLPRGPDAP